MRPYQRDFLQFALDRHVLRFGEFTLKSGRVSPYFFNAGLFDSGQSLARLGQYYADAIQADGLPWDMLYGPAYKGIPLAAAVAIALHERHGRDAPYAFNRKEAKDHGEGGVTVGAPIRGRVLIVDDVISAGTSVRESVDLIRAQGGVPVGVAIALDRQERGAGATSAVEQVEADDGLRVIPIAGLTDLIRFLEAQPGNEADLARVQAYQAEYGV